MPCHAMNHHVAPLHNYLFILFFFFLLFQFQLQTRTLLYYSSTCFPLIYSSYVNNNLENCVNVINDGIVLLLLFTPPLPYTVF